MNADTHVDTNCDLSLLEQVKVIIIYILLIIPMFWCSLDFNYIST